MKNLLKKQSEIRNNILTQYNNYSYTIEKPYIILNPYGTCPLSALMKFKTTSKCKLQVTIENDISFITEEATTEHSLIITGLLPNNKNKITITSIDNSLNKVTHYIQTEELPCSYPKIEVVNSTPSKMEGRFTAMSLGKSDGVKTINHLYSIIDENADVRWLYTDVSCHVLQKLKNGNLIVDAPISSGICGAYTSCGFIEINLLGEILNFYPIPNGLHHDVYELPNGNFLSITQRENTKQDLLIEIDRETKAIINEWDFRKILDFERPTVIDKISVNHPLDWLHLNSLVYSEADNCIIASSRNQSTVVKFNKDTSEIKWILSPHDFWKDEFKKYLLTPIGDNFEWSWAQHTPKLLENSNILVFDNGNYRSYNLETATLAYKNYSRGVEYKINENNMTIEQVWQFGKERGSDLYCAYLGSISNLKNNRILCFGGITKDIFGNPIDDMKSNRMKNQVTIVETTQSNPAEVVFEIKMKNTDITTANGFKCYRAEKINLY